jgi:hypothetical protein
MNDKLKHWIESGMHLPKVMRSPESRLLASSMIFEVTKDISEKHLITLTEEMAYRYMFECFLPFMAEHGYVIRRSRLDMPFQDLQSEMAAFKRQDYRNCMKPMDGRVERWRKKYTFMPSEFREFHEQKDLLKALFDTRVPSISEALNINIIQGHCYLFDCFLWVLARFGLVLQRSRSPQDFADLGALINANTKRRGDFFTAILMRSAETK